MKKTARRGTSRKRGTPPPEASFGDLVANVDLTDVRLVSVSATIVADEALNTDPTDEAFQLYLSPPEFRGQLDDDGGILYCGVRLRATEHIGDAEGVDPPSRPVAEISAEYALLYSVRAPMRVSDDVAIQFAGRNAVFNAWPFFRELTHSLASRMGLPQAVLPLFRLGAYPPKQPATDTQMPPRPARKPKH